MKTITLYHGTSQTFDSFDYGHIGKNGTSKGYGFYFTNSLARAQMYAMKDSMIYKGSPTVLQCEVTLHKPFSLTHKTIRLYEFRRLLDLLEDRILMCYEDKYSAEAELAFSDSDSDTINSLVHGTGTPKRVLQAVYSSLGRNYAREESSTFTDYIIISSEDIHIVKRLSMEDR